jgi:hypothetical protein
MKFFFAIIYLLLGFTSYSQKPGSPSDGVIFGKIIDTKTNQAIEYVAVRLLNVKDSSVVSGLFTDMDGKFNFQNVAYKKYLIKIC